MKFGQLLEYNMRNISVEKSYTTCVGETTVRLFYERDEYISGSIANIV